MYGNTTNQPPTLSHESEHHEQEGFVDIKSLDTYHIEKNVIRRTIVDGQHCEMAKPI